MAEVLSPPRRAWLLQAADERRNAPDQQVWLQLLLPARLAARGALGLVDADALECGDDAVTAAARQLRRHIHSPFSALRYSTTEDRPNSVVATLTSRRRGRSR